MYICLCVGVTDSKINQAIDSGCKTLKELKRVTGAMTGCCKCCDSCKELLLARTVYEETNEESDICQS